MTERTRSTIAVIAITIMFILGAYVDGHADSYKTQFEYNYSYEVRNSCRHHAGTGRHTDFSKAVKCADELVVEIKKEEDRNVWNGYLRSATRLNNQRVTDRRRR